MAVERSIAEKLCLACGLCCNGVLFADVQLQSGDKPEALKQLGLPIRMATDKFPQPCTAFVDCRCRIYANRPKHCRQFECLLLKETGAGTVTVDSALRTIRQAKNRATKVEKLLQQLGDTDTRLALSKRFQKMKRRIESEPVTEQTADLFGELTLAVHDLNLILGQSFYP